MFFHTKKKERMVRDSDAPHMTLQPLAEEEDTALIQPTFSFITAIMKLYIIRAKLCHYSCYYQSWPQAFAGAKLKCFMCP